MISQPLVKSSPLHQEILQKEITQTHLPSMQDYVKSKNIILIRKPSSSAGISSNSNPK